MLLATETNLRNIIGTLQTYRRMAADVAVGKPTPDLLGQIAQIDRIIDAARPLLAEVSEQEDAQNIALIRSVSALRRLLL